MGQVLKQCINMRFTRGDKKKPRKVLPCLYPSLKIDKMLTYNTLVNFKMICDKDTGKKLSSCLVPVAKVTQGNVTRRSQCYISLLQF